MQLWYSVLRNVLSHVLVRCVESLEAVVTVLSLNGPTDTSSTLFSDMSAWSPDSALALDLVHSLLVAYRCYTIGADQPSRA